MASHQLKRSVRGALAAGAVIAAISVFSAPASAQPPAPPPPANASEALKLFQEASKEASLVQEDLLKAQVDLGAKQSELDKATGETNSAKQVKEHALTQKEQLHGKVDVLTGAAFQGARFSKLSALMTGQSAQDFLDRASALNILADDNKVAIDRYTGVVNQAADAEKRAADGQARAQAAKDAQAKLIAQINERKSALEGRKTALQQAMGRLSAAEKKKLEQDDDQTVIIPPAGAAGKAVAVALAQRGKPYVWGAEGPGSYDCSGLVLYAYRAAGMSLPHSSRAQYGYGRSVSKSELAAGDLLFYGNSASSIHHVAMYIGDGKIVHASTSGVPVKVESVSGGGSDFYGAKRLVG
ncbi:cell wall-associated NlpC family hydrolase [Herbihabitans rhizosphaerae]|uniref:Cell wall-associated NlpC family hydrolase n=1 Tax=Herbihabitans rhizosphaerae TaxID=1872711 RepID=A0A4Q7KQU2_9PSEU|nr:C40 family peptidase [Herbihabitans rhizosphaerae]RZS38905.1 cell wall-associated NlpC family hydrolase [Herbihabitans rhizosphaerae]